MKTLTILLLFTAAAVAQTTRPMDITKPPEKDEHTVLLLHFDETPEPEAKVSGATPVEGKFGKALSFDGLDDYVSCGGDRGKPASFDFGENTDFTIEFWLNTTSTVRSSPVVTKKLRGGFEEPGFSIMVDGVMRAVIADGINAVALQHPAKVNDGKWHHVALVVNRKADAVLYVDGKAGKPEPVHYLTSVTNPVRDLRLMDRGHDAGTKGSIDEVRISNVARPMSPTTAPAGK